MLTISFHENVDDSLLKFAVIISKTNGKCVLCKYKERDTYEVPLDTERKLNHFRDSKTRTY